MCKRAARTVDQRPATARSDNSLLHFLALGLSQAVSHTTSKEKPGRNPKVFALREARHRGAPLLGPQLTRVTPASSPRHATHCPEALTDPQALSSALASRLPHSRTAALGPRLLPLPACAWAYYRRSSTSQPRHLSTLPSYSPLVCVTSLQKTAISPPSPTETLHGLLPFSRSGR
jgi:hypothetical protein